jgi:ABC-type Fe3+ transport system permease subunit
VKKVLYLLTAFLFIFLVILPLFMIVFDSFFKDGIFTFESYYEILNQKTVLLLLKSLGLAFLVSLISTIIGGFFAFFLTKTDLPLKNLFKLIFLIPLFLSPYILTLSWVDFFIQFDGGKSFIYSFWGVVFILSLVFSPLSMLIISSGLSNINSKLEEAGLMMTTYPKVMLKIIFPLVKPSVISSFILVFVLALSEFSVPAFLSVNVLTTEIFIQFSAFYNYDLAIANSMILIIICISLLMMERFSLANATFLSIGTRSHKVKTIELKKLKYLFFSIAVVYIFIAIIIPIIVLSMQTFQEGLATFYKALTLLTPNILDSLLYATIGAFILLVLGFVFAYMSEREKLPAINLVLLITFGIPSTVLGIALIKFFNTPSLNFIYSSFWIIIIAYLGKFIFITQKLLANALKQIPLSFEESATLIGANFFTRMQKIVLPQISNALFATFLIGFIFCLGELGATILVYPAGTSLMPIKVYTIMANAPQSLVSALSLIIMMITMLALTVLYLGNKILGALK